ncbi:MAG: sulfite exporter TauE/SafE family protein [Deltaproteobacteria bacterium]|nr:sulfite exporter TauE/SafE family protein [Deltaproteobacteria bacterium]
MIYIAPLFFLTALVYATVGFGGGSTYLALLVLFNFPYESMPKVALLCNVIVVCGGLYHYIRAGDFSMRQVLPFVLSSVPMAYLGGKVPIEKKLFLVLLAVSLGIAGLRLLWIQKDFTSREKISWQTAWFVGLPVGGVLGFVSGLVGIGGGIFLSPLFYLLGWGQGRQIAASASFFILVNSLAGLLGQWSKAGVALDLPVLLPLSFAVLVGGQIGSRWSVGVLSLSALQRITALLILFVAGKILWGFL